MLRTNHHQAARSHASSPDIPFSVKSSLMLSIHLRFGLLSFSSMAHPCLKRSWNQKWYRSNGVQPKENRNAGRNNTRAFSFEDLKRTVAFVSNYADDHGMVMPGRVPGFKRDDIKLMPSSETKVNVYKAYRTAMQQVGMYLCNSQSQWEVWWVVCNVYPC